MSKESHLNFSLNTHFVLTNISSVNPYFLVHHFYFVLPAMLFGTSNNPMCHIFLILSSTFISCLNHIFLAYYFLLASVQSLSHRQWLLSHPTHHHKRHLSIADTSEVESKVILMGHPISCCHAPVVRSFFIHCKMIISP
jgi:hypothetical protein